MPDPQIEKLLIVQDRDVVLQKIEQELARIPQERSALEGHITAEEANIEAASHALKEKEVERSELDTEICLLYTSPSPRDKRQSRMPSSA